MPVDAGHQTAKHNNAVTIVMPVSIPIPVGTRFSRLIVIGPAERKNGLPQSLCLCDCGNYRTALNKLLKRGDTKSCGCIVQEGTRLRHGHSRGGGTATYRSWEAIKKRCNRPSDPDYKNYGGRGIKVCQAWANSFEQFLMDVGECPPGMTIERINNEGDYCPGNVRWATRTEQGRNKRSNVIVTVLGKTGCVSEIAEHFGVNYQLFRTRLANGWNPDEAALTPPRPLNRKILPKHMQPRLPPSQPA